MPNFEIWSWNNRRREKFQERENKRAKENLQAWALKSVEMKKIKLRRQNWKGKQYSPSTTSVRSLCLLAGTGSYWVSLFGGRLWVWSHPEEDIWLVLSPDPYFNNLYSNIVSKWMCPDRIRSKFISPLYILHQKR